MNCPEKKERIEALYIGGCTCRKVLQESNRILHTVKSSGKFKNRAWEGELCMVSNLDVSQNLEIEKYQCVSQIKKYTFSLFFLTKSMWFCTYQMPMSKSVVV